MRRRRLLAQEVARFLRKGGDPTVALQAVCLALVPKLENSSLDPGTGNRVFFTSALLPEAILPELESIWRAVRGELSSLPSDGWPSLATVLWEWIDPEHIAPGVPVSEETARILRHLAASVIQDLVPLVRTSPGLASELRPLATRLGMTLELPGDPAFDLLFPQPDLDAVPQPDVPALRELVATWSRQSPREVARRLAGCEREARQIERRWPRHTPWVCRELASRIEVPADWLNAFFEEKLPGDLAEPFLREIVRRRPAGWDALLDTWFDHQAWSATVASVLAGVADLPSRLEERTLTRLAGQPHLIFLLALRGEIWLSRLRALLRWPDGEAALAAAVGTWSADPQGSIPPDLTDDWRQAILRAGSDIEDRSLRSALAQVLGGDPALAFEWLGVRIESGTIPLDLAFRFAEKGPFRTALSVLDAGQRRELLRRVVPSVGLKGLLPYLIGKDVALYWQLLDRVDLRDYHLAPLQGIPDPEWIPLAVAAVQAGWEETEIAGATVWDGLPEHSFWGTGLEYWSRWHRSFAALETDPHPEIRAIGRAGQRVVEPMIESSRKKEKEIALHGL
jgi:hypothetical protein